MLVKLGNRVAACAAAISVLVACGGTSTTAHATPSPVTSPVSHGVPMPPPAEHPNYPPQNLPDLIALADRGVARHFIGMEGQPIGQGCDRGWMRVYEPAGIPAPQEAADLLKVSIQRHAFQESCGAYIFGTTDASYCNCYHAENGYIEIDRGPAAEPAPGKMLVIFTQKDNEASPVDWRVEVDAPTA